MTKVTGQNDETKAYFLTPQVIHNEPSRVERLLSSVFLYAGLGLTAAVAAAGGWAVWNSAPPKPAPVVAEKPPPSPPVVVEKPPPPPSEPEHQVPADHPVASEAENPPGDPAVRALLDRGKALVTPPYSAFRWQQAHQDFEKALGWMQPLMKPGLAWLTSSAVNCRTSGRRFFKKTRDELSNYWSRYWIEATQRTGWRRLILN